MADDVTPAADAPAAELEDFGAYRPMDPHGETAEALIAGDESAAPAAVLSVLTNGARGTPPESGAVAWTRLEAERLAESLASRLATRYQIATKGSAAAARYIALLEDPSPVGGLLLDFARLTDEERAEYRAAGRTLNAAAHLLNRAGPLAAHEAPQPPDRLTVDLGDGEPPVSFTPHDWAVAEALWHRQLGRRAGVVPFGALPHDTYRELPTVAPYAATWARLQQKATLTPDEVAVQLRDELATRGVPSLSAWLEASGFGAHDWPGLRSRVVLALDEAADYEERKALLRGKQEAEARAAALAQELEEERARKRRTPALRQGLGWLRATTATREAHVADARKRGQLGKLGPRLTTEEAEARKLFKYEPLGWAERLVVHALAALAREQGKLEAHPRALRRRTMAADDAPRVRLAFPGVAELARVAGYEPDASGRIPKEAREAIQRALQALTTRPRWVAEPVLVPVKRGRREELVEDVRVMQTLWVEASSTVLTKHVELRLHPVAFASHLASYVPVGNLAARYDAAKRAIGRPRMRDEWAAADDYLRYLASVKLGDVRATAARAAKASGATPDEGAARGAAAVAAVGDSVHADVTDATLRDALGLSRLARDRGEAVARERVADALAFAQAMGTLRAYALEEGTKGPTWRLELAPPAVHADAGDTTQSQLFAAAAAPELPAGEAP